MSWALECFLEILFLLFLHQIIWYNCKKLEIERMGIGEIVYREYNYMDKGYLWCSQKLSFSTFLKEQAPSLWENRWCLHYRITEGNGL